MKGILTRDKCCGSDMISSLRLVSFLRSGCNVGNCFPQLFLMLETHNNAASLTTC